MNLARRRSGPAPILADIVVEDAAWGEPAALQGLVDRAVAVAVEVARLPVPRDAEIAVLFVDDSRMRGLNREHRGKDKPTNVLSFPAGPTPPRIPLLGDIVLARETIAAEAAAEGKTREQHLAHLVVHGLLHLFGHDHEDDAAAERMEALETRILARLGLPDPHSGGE